MNKENELLPCPFCGGKAVLIEKWEKVFGFFVECSECVTSNYYSTSKEEAVKAWNKRVYPDDVQEAIDSQTQKRVEVSRYINGCVWHFCPECGDVPCDEECNPYSFCANCGQALDWSDTKYDRGKK